MLVDVCVGAYMPNVYALLVAVVDLTLLPEEQVLNGNQPDMDDCVTLACENQDEEAVAMVEESRSGILSYQLQCLLV